jgi:spore germination protein PB
MHVTQNIHIQVLRINGISNSSVLQIGTAGIIKPLSNLYNTGEFTAPAPQFAQSPGWLPLVPFAPETRL